MHLASVRLMRTRLNILPAIQAAISAKRDEFNSILITVSIIILTMISYSKLEGK